MPIIRFYKNRLFFISSILIIFIIILLSSIYILDHSSNSAPLNSYDSLKTQAKELSNDPTINDDINYQKMLSQIMKLENKNLSKKEKANISELAFSYLVNAYYSTHDNRLFGFGQKLQSFMKENLGESAKFYPPCYDPKCADGPIPKEVQTVIEEVKSSNIPQELKDTVVLDLTNYAYLKNGYGLPTYNVKIGSFVSEANNIKINPDFIKAGINEKIYNEIIDYIKKTYPNDYQGFIR